MYAVDMVSSDWCNAIGVSALLNGTSTVKKSTLRAVLIVGKAIQHSIRIFEKRFSHTCALHPG